MLPHPYGRDGERCDRVKPSERSGTVAEIRQRLVAEMKRVYGRDQRRVSHALRVLEYAEAISRVEGGSPLIIKAAAILHDIGIHEAERRHGSAAGRYQEIEGPPLARKILQKIELDADVIAHVCLIVGSHHSARDIDTLEFRIVWDADWLVNLPDEYPDASKEKLAKLTSRIFRTRQGRKIATEIFR